MFQTAGRQGEAITELHKAIELRPDNTLAHNSLGVALHYNKQLDKAIQEYRRAIELDPKCTAAHVNLGLALRDKKQLDEAIQECRRAIELDPKSAAAHLNLGNALGDKKQLDEAIQEYRRVVELDPKSALAHNHLGYALQEKKQLDGAIQEYRRATELDPNFALAHNNLGFALREAGKLTESLNAFRTGRRLGSGQPEWVQDAERLVEQDRKLAAIREGKEKPADDAERLALAQLCQLPYKKLYVASARFFSEAFAHDAKFADDMQKQNRYNAACAAALAGCGQGHDGDNLEDKERAGLRQQAVEWLRADIAYWTKQAASDKSADGDRMRQTLRHWQEDSDLSGLRDPAELAKLPADEQEACRKLWVDVQAALDKADAKK